MIFEEVLGKLGEPDEKEGGNVIRISIAYSRLGIEFTFDTNFWENNSARIEQVALFKAKSKKTKCGICKADAEYKCSRCKLVYYCKKECQATHWKVHKKYCE